MAKIFPAILSFKGTSLTDEEKQFFARVNPLGLAFFPRNIQSKEQLQKLIKEIKELLGRNDLILAVDQEGGRVRRLVEPEFKSYASEYILGKLPTKISVLHAKLIAADLRELGLNTNFAPVLDVETPSSSEAIKSRSFGDDSQAVAERGLSMVKAYKQCGIIPCIKHIPGLGKAKTDSHLQLPIIKNFLINLEPDFYPFKVCAQEAPLAMTAHIKIASVDRQIAVTQSAKVIQEIIRQKIGFDGLLISDAIEMKALSGNLAEKTVKCLAAGCDCICYAAGNLAEMLQIASTKAELSEQGLCRLQRACKILHKRRCATADYAAYQQAVGPMEEYQYNYDMTEVLTKMKKK